ncbi:MAG: hypothetical protein JXX29_09390, partial [Deltaproteobacteria bacterium]|nr:hypothetical protein [Deltaproteobacteria bacterium]
MRMKSVFTNHYLYFLRPSNSLHSASFKMVLLGFAFVFASIGGLIQTATADVSIDIRVNGILQAESNWTSYIVYVSDCSRVLSLNSYNGEQTDVQTVENSIGVSDIADGCEFLIEQSGEEHLSPQIELLFADGTTQSYEEYFSIESNAPELIFDESQGVALQQVNDSQMIILQFTAEDDVDLSYLSYEFTGLRGSDLRAAGGVIDVARKTAFAQTKGAMRLYPRADMQRVFTAQIPLADGVIEDNEFYQNGLLFVEIEVVDASGNVNSISRMFTPGGELQEEALSIAAFPENIVFTNIAESIQIIPRVEFEFRGETELLGAGHGVQYSSSHPELVKVTTAGVVYPLVESTTEAITITVSYPGVPFPIEIPVQIDTNKNITSLRAGGLDEQGQFVLPRLNKQFDFPRLLAVFDDGSESALTSQLSITWSLDTSAQGILEIDSDEILARAAVSSDTPLYLHAAIELPDLTHVSADIPIAAIDAIPTASIQVSSAHVKVDEPLVISADAEDDVAVGQVHFYLDDVLLGTRWGEPFELSVTMSDEQANSDIAVSVVPVDSAGQQGAASTKTIHVESINSGEQERAQLISPTLQARFIEASPVSYEVGFVHGEETPQLSKALYAEFYVDGSYVGRVNFPIIKKILPPGMSQYLFTEIWSFKTMVPEIATNETSLSFYAMLHMRDGSTVQSDSGMIRVVENQAPNAQIISPINGTVLAVGQTVQIVGEVADDTLYWGTEVTLLHNDEIRSRTVYENNDEEFANASIRREKFTFDVAILEEMLGTSQTFRLQVRDAHGRTGNSENISLVVRQDTPPSVAVTYPTEGTTFVAGMSMELRANAVDDVGVSRVDFYVDSKLVGSDYNSPYAYAYDPDVVVESERPMTIYAVAEDTRKNRVQSETVTVLIGKDSQPPVVNVASPAVTGTDGGQDIAEVLENTTLAVKASGFDNVKVTSVELRGVGLSSGIYTFTGNLTDVITGTQFSPEEVPGALKAFSAIKMIKVPSYVEGNRYPLEVMATDQAGNSSTARINVAVKDDEAPEISEIRSDRVVYFPKDTVGVYVAARDDLMVSQVNVAFYLDDEVVARHSENRILEIQGALIQEKFELNLKDLALANENHDLRVIAEVSDNVGQSVSSEVLFPIQSDTTQPILTINSPSIGETLYRGEAKTLAWRATDESELSLVRISMNDSQIYSTDLSADALRVASGSVSFNVPASGTDVLFHTYVEDVFGNVNEQDWAYVVQGDAAPEIYFSSPPPGMRLEEGDDLDLAFYVSDDRQVVAATVFVDTGSETQVLDMFSSDVISDATQAGNPLYSWLHVPHGPDEGEPEVQVGVIATDNAGNSTTEYLELEILDDLEPPVIHMETPAETLYKLPGEYIEIIGSGRDNLYIESFEPLLLDAASAEVNFERVSLVREASIETKSVANPNSFGSVIVSTTYVLDVSGRVQLPSDAVAGETYTLYLTGNDSGRNFVESERISVVITEPQPDTTGPKISVKRPNDSEYELLNIESDVYISDEESALGDYEIIFDGIVVASGTDGAAHQRTFRPVIDIPQFDEEDDGNNRKIFSVVASDIHGNESSFSKIVTVQDDLSPAFYVADVVPSDEVVRGGLSYQTIIVNNDYASGDHPLTYFPFYSSLSRLGSLEGVSNGRTVLGDSIEVGDERIPFVSVEYPEGSALPGTIYLYGEEYIDADENGQLHIWPSFWTSGAAASEQYLEIDFGPEYTVKYLIEEFSEDVCSAFWEEYEKYTEDDPSTTEVNEKGVQLLSSAYPHSLRIDPIVTDTDGNEIETFIDYIQVDSKDIKNITRYSVAGGTSHEVRVQPVISVFVKDNRDGENRTALVGSSSLVRHTRNGPS